MDKCDDKIQFSTKIPLHGIFNENFDGYGKTFLVDTVNLLHTDYEAESTESIKQSRVWDDFIHMIQGTACTVGGLQVTYGKVDKEMWVAAHFGGSYNWLNIYVKQWGRYWIIGVAPHENLRNALMGFDENYTDRFIEQWSLHPNIVRKELDKGVQLMLKVLQLQAKACGFKPKYLTSRYTTDSYMLPEGQRLTNVIKKTTTRLQKWDASLSAKIKKTKTRAEHLRFAI
jgi:hypothetical protein